MHIKLFICHNGLLISKNENIDYIPSITSIIYMALTPNNTPNFLTLLSFTKVNSPKQANWILV